VLHGNTRYIACLHHPDANVFRLMGQRLPETGNLTPTGHVSAGRPRSVWTPASEYVTIAAVGRQPWISWGLNRTGITVSATINCAHATDLGQHICFKIVILYGCNFANGNDIRTCGEPLLYTSARVHTHTHPFQITVLNRSTSPHSRMYTLKTRTRI